MNKEDKIRNLHRFFLKKFRPKKPVILRFQKLKGYRASYDYNWNRHLIILNKKDNYYTLIDSCNHEWGHLLERNKTEYKDNKKNHSDYWGKCVARVYRAYLEWTEKDNK